MSNRERWMIYPLLFFSLSLSTKTLVTQLTGIDTPLVNCRQLTLTSRDGSARLRLLGGEDAGWIELIDQQGIPRIILQTDAVTGGGRLDIGGPDRTAQLRLEGNEGGGRLLLQSSDGRLEIVVGHSGQPPYTGLFATYDGYLIRRGREGPPWGQQLSYPSSPPNHAAESGEASSNEPAASRIPPVNESADGSAASIPAPADGTAQPAAHSAPLPADSPNRR